eukprot:TRINITY_DN6838_c0_g1_i1.p1 TRINITY_DN6838_c0_g1~~TRINITY_DN6838_c0_g1_i1.p1  ORF type:complete len:975 (+),score=302.24 TRINITY_DN6838_c0_g1_i1:90-3014(+)
MPTHADPGGATPDDGVLDGLLADDDGGDGQALPVEGGDAEDTLAGLLGDDDEGDEGGGGVLDSLVDEGDEDVPAAAPAKPAEGTRTRFEDLGGPIQQLLREVGNEGDMSQEDLRMFSHVPVRLLALAWERLGQGGDPQAVLEWLRKQGLRADAEKEIREARKGAPPPAAPASPQSPFAGGTGGADAAAAEGDVLGGLLEADDDAEEDVLSGLLDDDGDKDVASDGGDDDGGLADLLAQEVDEDTDKPAAEADDSDLIALQSLVKDIEDTLVEEPKPLQPRKPPPPPEWNGVLPLKNVPNPRWFRAAFVTMKHMPHLHQVVAGDHRRLWVVDVFGGTFTEYDRGGKRRRQFHATKLLQVERSCNDPMLLRLLFLGAGKSFELMLQSGFHRERFFEVANAVRPAIRTVAPALLKQGRPKPGYLTIDAKGPNRRKMRAPNPVRPSQLMDIPLEGECKISCSTREDDVITVWTGTWNHRGQMPKAEALAKWLPAGSKSHDLYCVAAQECTWQQRPGDWCRAVHARLGRDQFLVLASHQVGGLVVVVLSRKRLLLSVTNVEGAGTEVGTGRCAVGIALRVHNTAMAFVAVYLPKTVAKKDPLRPGQLVEARGLVNATELNGVRGKVVAKDAGGERWHVIFSDDSEQSPAPRQKRSLHPDNLVALEEPNRLAVDLTRVLAQLRIGANAADICAQFHHVFLMGHMATCCEMSTKRIGQLVKAGNFVRQVPSAKGAQANRNIIADSDNIYRARKRGVLFGFTEELARFPPTDPDQGTRGGDAAYTDRVLFRNLPGTGMRCNGYAATTGAGSGLHPVAASFAVRCLRPFLACFDPCPGLNFELLSFVATPVQRALPRKTKLGLWSPMLAATPEVQGAAVGTEPRQGEGGRAVDFKERKGLPPPLMMVNSMAGYLARQFVVVILRNAEGDEDASFQSAACVFFAGEGHAAAIENPGQELSGTGSLQRHGRTVGTWDLRYRFVAR